MAEENPRSPVDRQTTRYGKPSICSTLCGVVGQALQLVVGMVRLYELDKLDLVELVLTDQTSGVAAGTPASARKQAE